MSLRSARILKMVLEPELHSVSVHQSVHAATDVVQAKVIAEVSQLNTVQLGCSNLSTWMNQENCDPIINRPGTSSENVDNENTSDIINKPSTPRENVDIDDALSSDLDSEQEKLSNTLAFIFDDSDCSVKDKDYVPETDKSSSDEDIDKNVNQSKNGTLDAKLRTRWKKSEPSTWKKNISKRQKVEAKAPNPVDCLKCRFKCNEKVSEKKRNLICKNYWNCDFNRRKDFILSNVESCVPERRRSVPGSSKKRRLDSKSYFFDSDSIKIRVCKKFFIQTLRISKEVIEHAFKFKGEGGMFTSEDKRGKKEPHNKSKICDVEKVRSHIESFPVTDSHYTRKSTKRQYLDSKLNIAKMHGLYKEICIADDSKPVSLITYRRIFCKNYNYSFYKPKKDQCQICSQYNTTEIEKRNQLQENYEHHIIRKNDCYQAKMQDKERALQEKNFVCCTFDLQCVLQIPSSDVSPMYYSRKLCTYNLTIYELAPPNNAYCFAWTEINGKRGSLEIGTCLFKYIEQLPNSITDLSLFSDTCSGQNRNQNISALFLYLVQRSPYLQVIEQKYLESGHSYMEVDSMHSAIEKAQKYVPVYTMQDWLTIFRMARTCRSSKKPFNIQELKYKDFLDLEQLAKLLMKNRNKNTNGEKVNWLKIKCFRYLKCKPGILQYRYDHTSDYMEINVSGKGRPINLNDLIIKNAYSKVHPISTQKKQDLLKLCKSGAIPNEFHQYYKVLPTSNAVKDAIPEPAADDSDVEIECDDD